VTRHTRTISSWSTWPTGTRPRAGTTTCLPCAAAGSRPSGRWRTTRRCGAPRRLRARGPRSAARPWTCCAGTRGPRAKPGSNLAYRAAWAWGGPVLIDALLDDGDLDAAWAAAEDGAPEAQLLRLADASVTARPADALAVYRKAIGPLKRLTGDNVYRRIAALLLSARACHEALGTTDEFRRYVALLRMDQKRKRNLMRILDENGL
jgi:hypothetical protein